jgi:hypothetical protein
VAGGSLDIQSDPNFSFNLGGSPTPVFDNQGTLSRSTSTGTATINAFFQNTDTVLVSAGTLSLTGGGSLAGTAISVASGAFLDLNGQTFTLVPGLNVSGLGTVRVQSGTVTTALAADTAAFTNLQLNGGTFSQPGVVLISGVFDWLSGSLSEGGGTVHVQSGATMSIAGSLTRVVRNHVLENAGTATWSGNFVISVGGTPQGGVIRNLPGAVFDVQSTNSISAGIGGTARFENQGTLRRTAAGTGSISIPIEHTGAFDVQVDTLSLRGGSVNSFTGTGSAAAGAVLELGASTYTLTGTFAMTGDIAVNNGTLVLNGNTMTVASTFSTGQSGTLVMTNAADSLDINGNAIFGGAASTLNNGVIRLSGDFTQGGFTNSFAPTASSPHRVVLDGSVTQNLTFANATSSFFRRLEINKPAGDVALASDVRASHFRIIGTAATQVTGAFRLMTDTVTGTNFSSSIQPLVVEVTGVITDSGAFTPDTTVFTGSNQTIPFSIGFTTYAYKSIRVHQSSGTATFSSNSTVNGDLVVSRGTLALSSAFGNQIPVVGNFRTEGIGALQMANSGDSLGVAGTATFGGATTSGLLTAGRLVVGGDFTQTAATSTSAFAPSGTHRTVLNGSSTQNIGFASPTTSFFDVLDIPSTSTRNIVLQTNVMVSDSLLVLGGAAPTDVIGAGTTQRLRVNGVLRVTQQTASPLVAPPVLELSLLPSVDSIFATGRGVSPDTTVFLGSLTTLPEGTPMRYKNVRIATSGTISYSSSNSAPDTIAGHLTIDGTARLDLGATGFGLVVTGQFRTISSGSLQMQNSGALLTVNDSVIFGGGSVNPTGGTSLLSAGTIRVLGHFVQSTANSNRSFNAEPFHTVEFAGPAAQTVRLANPGFTGDSAHFGVVRFANATAGGVTFLSDVVTHVWQDTTTGTAESVFGRGFRLRPQGLDVNNAVLDNAEVLVTDGFSITALNTVTFQNYPALPDILTVRRASGTHTFGSLTFPSSYGGRYVVADDTDAISPFLGVSFNNPTPATITTAQCKTAGGASISWGNQGVIAC